MMRFIRSRVIPVFALVFFASILNARSAPTFQKSEPWPGRFSEQPERWDAVMKELRIPGMAVAVVEGDAELLVKGFGVRDPEKKAPVTRDTIFYLASSTKSFTAVAVLALADEGRLDLDAPVKKYLPRFQLQDPQLARSITVRDLLCHRHGLRGRKIQFGESFTGDMPDERFYRLLRNVRSRGEFTYTNLHYTLLGRVIEAVTNKPWKQVVREKILSPAGMNRTFCNVSEVSRAGNAAVPIQEIGGAWAPALIQKSDRSMSAAGGTSSSAADLARWLRLMINEGAIDGKRILSKKSVREMKEQQVVGGRGFFGIERHGYGLGWYIGSYDGEKLVHQFGSFAGARAHVSFMPDRKLGVAVVVNQDMPAFNFAELVAIDVYQKVLGLPADDKLATLRERAAQNRPNLPKAPDAALPRLAAQHLSLPPKSYEGDLTSPDWGTLALRHDKGFLLAKLGDVEVSLFANGTDRFTCTLIPRNMPPSDGHFDKQGERISSMTLDTGGIPMKFTRRPE